MSDEPKYYDLLNPPMNLSTTVTAGEDLKPGECVYLKDEKIYKLDDRVCGALKVIDHKNNNLSNACNIFFVISFMFLAYAFMASSSVVIQICGLMNFWFAYLSYGEIKTHKIISLYPQWTLKAEKEYNKKGPGS